MQEKAQTELVTYSVDEAGVANLVLNRPDQRNAQNAELLYQLNECFDRAARDNDVRVVVLSGAGPDFSTGHDLKSSQEEMAEAAKKRPSLSGWTDFEAPGAAGFYAIEQEIFLGFTKRWRNFPKPTIAAVQGNCIAAGLMLAWACDIIIASDDARFSDPVVSFGMPGVEWFAHPYELGPRKAKEFLFTSDRWNAQEAHRLGMVNHVVPAAELQPFVQQMARKIATKPPFALKLAKEAVNRAEDMGGKTMSIDAFFSLHHLSHQHNNVMFGTLMDPTGAPKMTRQKPRGS
ncbi:MAG: enoyl-CoA hydratase [Rhizobiaceae bacterium]|nr:enoyl-CoA hydratase [Rhizobiaceae bacterium]